MDNLEEKVVVVTGGGSGIGRASALAFAAAGSRVVVADVDATRSTEVAAEIEAGGSAAVGTACDVTSLDDLVALRTLTLDRFGPVDVIMNNVGVVSMGEPLDIPMADWQRLVDVNLLSIVRSNEVFLPDLLEQGRGHVVNTASIAGLYPYTYDLLPYSATKAAVVGLSEALAFYLRPRGIGITCLCPGPVLTNIVEQITAHTDLSKMRVPSLSLLDATTVGDMVVRAVREDRFLLLTHPDEVHDILVRRAADPEGWLTGAIEQFEAETPGG
jgi:NAD(P)-dependent dehydrogenase (short-subunit alcohol dehydrogenase family)